MRMPKSEVGSVKLESGSRKAEVGWGQGPFREQRACYSGTFDGVKTASRDTPKGTRSREEGGQPRVAVAAQVSRSSRAWVAATEAGAVGGKGRKTEDGGQRTERQSANAECRMPNAECGSPKWQRAEDGECVSYSGTFAGVRTAVRALRMVGAGLALPTGMSVFTMMTTAAFFSGK